MRKARTLFALLAAFALAACADVAAPETRTAPAEASLDSVPADNRGGNYMGGN